MALSSDPKEILFLEKIAQKLGRPTPTNTPTRKVSGPPDFWRTSNIPKEQLLREFVSNAEKLTVKTSIALSSTEIQTHLTKWLQEINAKSAICWDSPELKSERIADLCQTLGINLVFWNNREDRIGMINKCAQVDVGITWADYGIANTGSIAILSSPLQSRSVSLVPPVHIAILYRDSIVPHMGDIFATLDKDKLPSALNFITGPSRTSDIEMDLTLGVHGPGKVFILIVDK